MQKTRLSKPEAILNAKLLEGKTKFLFKFKNEIKKQRLRGVIQGKAKKALKYHRRKTHRSGFEDKKHENNSVRFTFGPAAGTRFRFVLTIMQSILSSSFKKGKANEVKYAPLFA